MVRCKIGGTPRALTISRNSSTQVALKKLRKDNDKDFENEVSLLMYYSCCILHRMSVDMCASSAGH